MKTEREKIIDIIQKSVDGCSEYWAGQVADGLLENGVFAPPCKVGDTVYEYDNVGRIYESEVVWFYYDKDYKRVVYDCNTELAFSEEAIGKTVFLSRKEAEKALKAREKE